MPTPAGGLLSVALSLGLPPPGVTRHRVSVEPGLSSIAKTATAAIRPTDARVIYTAVPTPSKPRMRRSAAKVDQVPASATPVTSAG